MIEFFTNLMLLLQLDVCPVTQVAMATQEHLNFVRSNRMNPIQYVIPKLLFRKGTPALLASYGSDVMKTKIVRQMMNVFSPSNVNESETFAFARYVSILCLCVVFWCSIGPLLMKGDQNVCVTLILHAAF